jgi:hypothetical protein
MRMDYEGRAGVTTEDEQCRMGTLKAEEENEDKMVD